jgi:hypothetical protein
MVSSLWQREAGRDFQNAKVLQNFKQNRFGHLIWVLGIYLGFVILKLGFEVAPSEITVTNEAEDYLSST